MDLTHRFSVPVSVEQAWRALNHLELLDQCFPGLTIDNVAGDAFTGSIKVKIGPIGLVYAGSGRYVERDSEAYRLVLESHGSDRRGNGTADARVVAALTGNGEGTDIDLSTDLTVTGKPAQFGADVIADVSDKLMAQFASCAASRLAEGFEAPPVPAPLHQARPTAVPEAVEEPETPEAAEESEPAESRRGTGGDDRAGRGTGGTRRSDPDRDGDRTPATRRPNRPPRRLPRPAPTGTPRPAISPNPTLGRSARP